MVQLTSGSDHFHSISLARIGHMAPSNLKEAKRYNPTMCLEGEEPELFDAQTYYHHLSQDWSQLY